MTDVYLLGEVWNLFLEHPMDQQEMCSIIQEKVLARPVLRSMYDIS